MVYPIAFIEFCSITINIKNALGIYMYNYTLSQIAGATTLGLMVLSYFFKNKSTYLFLQTMGLVSMFLSYLFGGEYFAMITLSVSLFRTLTFYIYEKKDKEAPIFFSFLFSALAITAYLTLNLLILGSAKPVDVLYLGAVVMYAFIFRIRNIKTVRCTLLVPHSLAVLYNLLLGNMLFVAASYLFELLADVYAIIKYTKNGTEE